MSGIKVREDGETLDIATADVGGFKVKIGDEVKSVLLVEPDSLNATKIRCKVGGSIKAWASGISEIYSLNYRRYVSAGADGWDDLSVRLEELWCECLSKWNLEEWHLIDFFQEPADFYATKWVYYAYTPGDRVKVSITGHEAYWRYNLKDYDDEGGKGVIKAVLLWEADNYSEKWVYQLPYYAEILWASVGKANVEPLEVEKTYPWKEIELDVISCFGQNPVTFHFYSVPNPASSSPAIVKPSDPSIGMYWWNESNKGGQIYVDEIIYYWLEGSDPDDFSQAKEIHPYPSYLG